MCENLSQHVQTRETSAHTPMHVYIPIPRCGRLSLCSPAFSIVSIDLTMYLNAKDRVQMQLDVRSGTQSKHPKFLNPNQLNPNPALGLACLLGLLRILLCLPAKIPCDERIVCLFP
jgi:hypothetical protein